MKLKQEWTCAVFESAAKLRGERKYVYRRMYRKWTGLTGDVTIERPRPHNVTLPASKKFHTAVCVVNSEILDRSSIKKTATLFWKKESWAMKKNLV